MDYFGQGITQLNETVTAVLGKTALAVIASISAMGGAVLALVDKNWLDSLAKLPLVAILGGVAIYSVRLVYLASKESASNRDHDIDRFTETLDKQAKQHREDIHEYFRKHDEFCRDMREVMIKASQSRVCPYDKKDTSS